MMVSKWAIAAPLFGLLAACGGTTMGDDGGDFVLPPAYQPFFTDNTVSDLLSQRSELAALDVSTAALLPAGTGQYTGVAALNLDVDDDGSTDHRLVARISLSAELGFLAGDDITGTISNVHTRDGTTATENIEGTLQITGSLSDETKRISGSIVGELDGYLGETTPQEFNLAGTFNGVLRKRVEVRTSQFFPPDTDQAAALTADATGQLGGDLAGGTFTGGFAADR